MGTDAGDARASDPARFYRERSGRDDHTSPGYVTGRLEQVLERAAVAGPALDVGCGVGTNLAVLTSRIPAVGIDVSANALAEAAASAPVAAADARALPFADGAFGLVVCTEVLEHVREPERVVDDVARVLRPRGLLFLTSPNYANPAGLRKAWRDRRSGRHDWNPWEAHRGGYEAFTTRRRLRRLLHPRFDVLWEEGFDSGLGLSAGLPRLGRIARTRAGSGALGALGRTVLAGDRPLGRRLAITTLLLARKRG